MQQITIKALMVTYNFFQCISRAKQEDITVLILFGIFFSYLHPKQCVRFNYTPVHVAPIVVPNVGSQLTVKLKKSRTFQIETFL